MEARNWIGILIIVLGVIFQPIGWMYYSWANVLSIVLIFIGVFIFATQKYIEHKENIEFGSQESLHKNTSLPIIGDIHNESGQRTGGRKDDWTSDFSGGGDGGAGD